MRKQTVKRRIFLSNAMMVLVILEDMIEDLTVRRVSDCNCRQWGRGFQSS